MWIAFRQTIERPWTDMEPVRIGSIPAGVGTPDCYLLVEDAGGPRLRVDLYHSSEECFPFTEACCWSNFVAVGWGHRLYLVRPETGALLTLELGSYFGHLYPDEAYLLVASAERLFRVQPDGTVRWRSEVVGIDGVTVSRVDGEVVTGQGEWDPPGGWRPFRLELTTGQPV